MTSIIGSAIHACLDRSIDGVLLLLLLLVVIIR